MHKDPNRIIRIAAGVSDEEFRSRISKCVFAAVTGNTAGVIIHDGLHRSDTTLVFALALNQHPVRLSGDLWRCLAYAGEIAEASEKGSNRLIPDECRL